MKHRRALRGPPRRVLLGPAPRPDDEPVVLSGARQGSWPSAAATMSRQLALTGPLGGPLGVPLLPCLADLLLLGWRYRAALDDSAQEQSDQDSEDSAGHYSMTWSARCSKHR